MTICVLYECCECMCASELSVNSVIRQKRMNWHRTMFRVSASQNYDRSFDAISNKATRNVLTLLSIIRQADIENENSIY